MNWFFPNEDESCSLHKSSRNPLGEDGDDGWEV